MDILVVSSRMMYILTAVVLFCLLSLDIGNSVKTWSKYAFIADRAYQRGPQENMVLMHGGKSVNASLINPSTAALSLPIGFDTGHWISLRTLRSKLAFAAGRVICLFRARRALTHIL